MAYVDHRPVLVCSDEDTTITVRGRHFDETGAHVELAIARHDGTFDLLVPAGVWRQFARAVERTLKAEEGLR